MNLPFLISHRNVLRVGMEKHPWIYWVISVLSFLCDDGMLMMVNGSSILVQDDFFVLDYINLKTSSIETQFSSQS